MNNMRRGFTMIELIFVIVIIGILAAVAIPKLAATRDDAKISGLIANTRTALGDMTSFYTSQGNSVWIDTATYITTASNVPLYAATDCPLVPIVPTDTEATAGNAFYLCDEAGGNTCITLTTDANGTSVTVAAVAVGASVICDGVVQDPALIGITGGPGQSKIHRLGGAGVVR